MARKLSGIERTCANDAFEFSFYCLQLAINESNGLKRVPKHLMLARDEFVYRSYLAMGQYDIVFDEIKEGPNTPVGELGIYYLLFYH